MYDLEIVIAFEIGRARARVENRIVFRVAIARQPDLDALIAFKNSRTRHAPAVQM